jgi:hypothetical protein
MEGRGKLMYVPRPVLCLSTCVSKVVCKTRIGHVQKVAHADVSKTGRKYKLLDFCTYFICSTSTTGVS